MTHVGSIDPLPLSDFPDIHVLAIMVPVEPATVASNDLSAGHLVDYMTFEAKVHWEHRIPLHSLRSGRAEVISKIIRCII